MCRIGIALAAATILLTNGVWEAVLTHRWYRSTELETGIQKLARVPMTIGDWQAQSLELDQASSARAEIEGYFYRQYENKFDGKVVTVLLMCGRPGPLSLHTPDVCYGGAGFRLDGAMADWPLQFGDGLSAPFKRAKFSKDNVADGTSVRIEWSWRADGKWGVPGSPRVAFARLPVLYKLYIVQRETPASEQSNEEVCKAFLQQLLPAIENALNAAE